MWHTGKGLWLLARLLLLRVCDSLVEIACIQRGLRLTFDCLRMELEPFIVLDGMPAFFGDLLSFEFLFRSVDISQSTSSKWIHGHLNSPFVRAFARSYCEFINAIGI